MGLKKLILTSVVLAVGVQGVVFANSDTFTSGEDWTHKMSVGEKYISLFAPTIVLRQYGVPIQITPEQYIPAIDRILEFNPQLLKEEVANIYVSTVYQFEPQTRPALRELESQFLRGELRPEWTPRLTVWDYLNEYSKATEE